MKNGKSNGQNANGDGSHGVEKTREDLVSLASSPAFIAATQEKRQQLIRDFVKHHPLVELAYMTSPEGTQTLPNVASSRVKVVYGGDGLGVDRSSRAWFTVTAKDKKPFTSRPYLSVATLRLCVTVSAPVVEEDGTLLGVLAADLKSGCH